MDSVSYEDVLLGVLAVGIAGGNGYDYKQGIRDGNDSYYQNLRNHQAIQQLNQPQSFQHSESWSRNQYLNDQRNLNNEFIQQLKANGAFK